MAARWLELHSRHRTYLVRVAVPVHVGKPVLRTSFFFPVLFGNMLDFFTTIIQSPDLSLETNTVWNSLKEVCGLQLALLYGLWGKIFLSGFAAVCFAFYLNTASLLFPRSYSGALSFVLNIGGACQSVRQRLRAFSSVFSFYFAAINVFCFYIAYANSLVTDASALSNLPALPAVIVISLCVVSVAFVLATYLVKRLYSLAIAR